MAAIVIAAAYVLSLAGDLHFMLDNLSSFKVHFALCFIGLWIMLALLRQKTWTALPIVGLICCLAEILPWHVTLQNEDAVSVGVTASVFASNLSPNNTDLHTLAGVIEKSAPDIVGLVELTPASRSGISTTLDAYPYRFEAPDNSPWGIGLYSRFPIVDAQLVRESEGEPPFIVATVAFESSVMTVVVLHPYPPRSAKLTARRNSTLGAVAALASDDDRPVLVMGDLNVALWSRVYRRFEAESRLVNSRRGYGVTGTWPPSKILGVPIDHVLVSRDIEVLDFRVMGFVGSDHLPVYASIKLPL
ncbi:MAG: endonuclease/exonuclease/phosphatase family protein [Pseudomonadota bacterium]